jgi:hypothetical protein
VRRTGLQFGGVWNVVIVAQAPDIQRREPLANLVPTRENAAHH